MRGRASAPEYLSHAAQRLEGSYRAGLRLTHKRQPRFSGDRAAQIALHCIGKIRGAVRRAISAPTTENFFSGESTNYISFSRKRVLLV
jgi:hypothetical protein